MKTRIISGVVAAAAVVGLLTLNSFFPITVVVEVAVLAAIAIYEMLYIDSIPASVAINEAVELVKVYGDEKTKGFVNGVLNSVKEEISK